MLEAAPPGRCADLLAAVLMPPPAARLAVLDAVDVPERLQLALSLVKVRQGWDGGSIRHPCSCSQPIVELPYKPCVVQGSQGAFCSLVALVVAGCAEGSASGSGRVG
jgi:hypothetical protein